MNNKIKCPHCNSMNSEKRENCWICGKSLKEGKTIIKEEKIGNTFIKDEILTSEIEKIKNEYTNTDRFNKKKKKNFIYSIRECKDFNEVMDFYCSYRGIIMNSNPWLIIGYGFSIPIGSEDEFIKNKNEFRYICSADIQDLIPLELERLDMPRRDIDFFRKYIKYKYETEYAWVKEVEDKLDDEWNKKLYEIDNDTKINNKEKKKKKDKLTLVFYDELMKINKPILEKLLKEIIGNANEIMEEYKDILKNYDVDIENDESTENDDIILKKKKRNSAIIDFLISTPFIIGTTLYITICISCWEYYGIKTLFLAPIFMFILFIIGCMGDSFREDMFGEKSKNMTPFEVSKEMKEYELLNKLNNKKK